MTGPLSLIAALVLGYALGSIPFGLILTRLAGTPDIRSIGSGNIGATNVLRTGRKGLAAATLLGDALKGTLAVLLASSWSAEAGLAAAVGALVGHAYPVWLSFKGGKGVATFLGTLVAVSPVAALGFALLWLGTAAVTRYSSASALLATAGTPLLLLAFGQPAAALVYAGLAAFVWWKHSANIARLMSGTESRIGGR
jgi:acyl phosphate:glycerol-3-phosphate acyltransferase